MGPTIHVRDRSVKTGIVRCLTIAISSSAVVVVVVGPIGVAVVIPIGVAVVVRHILLNCAKELQHL